VRVLITGATGFVGGHLARHLFDTMPDVVIHGTTLPSQKSEQNDGVIYHAIDLKQQKAVHDLIKNIQPDHIYHLAAQAFVPRSFEAPWETLENNISAQLNVITACIDAGIEPRILVISSAEIYGPVHPEELPLTEKAELRPTSPYSVSKIAQDMLALQYSISHGLPIMRARPFNHFGPGQNENFVAPAFAMQIARIEAGKQDATIYVGDLSAKRDFTDVRDIVRAYHAIIEHGIPGDVYNVCSGQSHTIEALLNELIKLSTSPITIAIDEARLRPVTIPELRGDCSHLHQVTGWQPQITFQQSLADILDDCRRRVKGA